jgi:hypothetical protein
MVLEFVVHGGGTSAHEELALEAGKFGADAVGGHEE